MDVVGQLREEPKSIRVVPENHVATVAAAGNVVNRIVRVGQIFNLP
jgi:hypothetical protein